MTRTEQRELSNTSRAAMQCILGNNTDRGGQTSHQNNTGFKSEAGGPEKTSAKESECGNKVTRQEKWRFNLPDKTWQ